MKKHNKLNVSDRLIFTAALSYYPVIREFDEKERNELQIGVVW